MLPNLNVILKLTAPDSSHIEGFQDSESNGFGLIASLGGLVSLLGLAILVLASFGASRLSWCYNMYLGNGTALSLFYATLAFFFSALYYPFYAWYLNPLCAMKMVPTMNAMAGGKRR